MENYLTLKTSHCIVTGREVTVWSGHVLADSAFGEVTILAGFANKLLASNTPSAIGGYCGQWKPSYGIICDQSPVINYKKVLKEFLKDIGYDKWKNDVETIVARCHNKSDHHLGTNQFERLASSIEDKIVFDKLQVGEKFSLCGDDVMVKISSILSGAKTLYNSVCISRSRWSKQFSDGMSYLVDDVAEVFKR